MRRNVNNLENTYSH